MVTTEEKHEIFIEGESYPIHCGRNADAANSLYMSFTNFARMRIGRAAGKTIVWLRNGETFRDTPPDLTL